MEDDILPPCIAWCLIYIEEIGIAFKNNIEQNRGIIILYIMIHGRKIALRF